MELEYFEVGVDVELFKEWLAYEVNPDYANLTKRELRRAMKEYILSKFREDNIPCAISKGE